MFFNFFIKHFHICDLIMFIISSFAFLIVVTLLFKAAPSHRKQFTTCQIYKTVVFFMKNTHTEHLVYTVINNTVITK
jgi:hypothetical protein